MAATQEREIEVSKIMGEIERLQSLIEQALKQLSDADKFQLPDTTPYFSFRTADKISDLKGIGGGLRSAIRHDIVVGKAKIRQLLEQARRIRRGEREALLDRKEDALVAADRYADRRAMGIIDNAARNNGGKLTEKEFAEVQGLMLQSLKGHTALMRNRPSRKNIAGTLDRLATLFVLTVDDPIATKAAFDGALQASGKLVDQAKRSFLKKPTPAGARQLVDELAENEKLGGTSAAAILDREVLPRLKADLEAAEKNFRRSPSMENCQALFNAEYAFVDAGGSPLPDPPSGLRRIKPGKTHFLKKGEMLSALSKTYYGSFSFWDVIVRANWGMFRDPDRPPVNVEITIPH